MSIWWFMDLVWKILVRLRLVSKTKKVLFTGLDNSGVATLLYSLSDHLSLAPFSKGSKTVKNFLSLGYDVIGYNGAELFRSLSAARRCHQQFHDFSGIVFMVDCSDVERFPEAKQELDSLLEVESLANIPVVVLGNKIDRPQAVSEEVLRAALGLNQTAGKQKEEKPSEQNKRKIEVFMCSVVHRQGYGVAFKWLSQYI
eukprot:TRINITY_DN1022_c0_g1_i1.p1 TRINITY_DN1022_c0_g1~~TRINITY_DN1022_c0_g1_i1.p1  ORF type:complete len:199 (+),score=40.78 TRINITY_DN1022_c0_g1_i1:151-747(+)